MMGSDLFRREEERENAETFGERHSDDGLNENFAGSGRITTDSLSCLLSDKSDADGGAEQSKRAGNVAGEFSDDGDHVVSFFCWLSTVRTPGTLPAAKDQ